MRTVARRPRLRPDRLAGGPAGQLPATVAGRVDETVRAGPVTHRGGGSNRIRSVLVLLVTRSRLSKWVNVMTDACGVARRVLAAQSLWRLAAAVGVTLVALVLLLAGPVRVAHADEAPGGTGQPAGAEPVGPQTPRGRLG